MNRTPLGEKQKTIARRRVKGNVYAGRHYSGEIYPPDFQMVASAVPAGQNHAAAAVSHHPYGLDNPQRGR